MASEPKISIPSSYTSKSYGSSAREIYTIPHGALCLWILCKIIQSVCFSVRFYHVPQACMLSLIYEDTGICLSWGIISSIHGIWFQGYYLVCLHRIRVPILVLEYNLLLCSIIGPAWDLELILNPVLELNKEKEKRWFSQLIWIFKKEKEIQKIPGVVYNHLYKWSCYVKVESSISVGNLFIVPPHVLWCDNKIYSIISTM